MKKDKIPYQKIAKLHKMLGHELKKFIIEKSKEIGKPK